MLGFVVEFGLLLVLILINGALAMSEIAIVSAKRVRLATRAKNGDVGARVALELANEPSQFLSTVQIGITLVGIIVGVFGGAQLGERVAPVFEPLPYIGGYSSEIGLGLVIIVSTYLSLVLGELVPKRMALGQADRIAVIVSRPMKLLAMVTAPFVRLLSVSTDGLLRMLGAQGSDASALTIEEIRALLDQARQEGVVEEVERDIVERVFLMDARRINLLMTPRTELIWLDVEDTEEKNWDKVIKGRHSYYPVCESDLENVLGVVSVKSLLEQARSGRPLDLRAALTQPIFVPETTFALDVLERLRESNAHTALVINEFGTTEGLVTPTNLLEAIVGELPDEGFQDDPQAFQRADGTWLLDGLLPLYVVEELFDVRLPHTETFPNYYTLGGFVMSYLGRVPRTGDVFEVGPLRFEVMDMDKRRVDKVLVSQQVPHFEEQQVA